jgi:type IV secretion system protein VirB1
LQQLLNNMDALAFAAIAATCAPLVHPGTAQAIVSVESGFDPHAVGVVAGELQRQPKSDAEAIATARQLRATGWNFSVGLAQINVHNLERLGLTIESAFDPCQNLRAMQTLLCDCFDRAGDGSSPQGDLRRALSCYYSGNYVTGFREGYVARVIAASRSVGTSSRAPPD